MYILDISPSTDSWFENIFSHSVGWLSWYPWGTKIFNYKSNLPIFLLPLILLPYLKTMLSYSFSSYIQVSDTVWVNFWIWCVYLLPFPLAMSWRSFHISSEERPHSYDTRVFSYIDLLNLFKQSPLIGYVSRLFVLFLHLVNNILEPKVFVFVFVFCIYSYSFRINT